MISLPHPVRVFLHAPATDLRKGFDAFCGSGDHGFCPGSNIGAPVLVREPTPRSHQDSLLGSRRPGDLVQAAPRSARSKFLLPPPKLCRSR